MGLAFAFGDTEEELAADRIYAGIACADEHQFRKAIAYFDLALLHAPHHENYAHWNKALALLALGEYEQGFIEAEYMYRVFSWRELGPLKQDIDRISHLPVWEGEDITDKSLLVYHELGFGDAIQAFRYLPELKRRAKHVSLVVDKSLVILADQFPVDVYEKIPQDVSAYDYRLPLFSVMKALRQTLATIPNKPYIKGYPYSLETKGRVGICWSGRTQKMFTLDSFLSMLDHKNFNIYSLQPDFVDDNHDVVIPLALEDFQDTADAIASLEHIVTVDSAVAHLAGAMGHPSTHVILPFKMDWRWWFSENWYPKIKVYRQEENTNEWASVFARLNEALGND